MGKIARNKAIINIFLFIFLRLKIMGQYFKNKVVTKNVTLKLYHKKTLQKGIFALFSNK